MELLYAIMGGVAVLATVGVVHVVHKYAPAVSAWWNKEKAVATAVAARFATIEADVKALKTKLGI